MKAFSFVQFFLLLIMIIAYQCAGAQDLLITNKGDTLRGKVKITTFGDTPKVQVQNEDGKNVISLFETKEVQMNGDIYHPQKGPGRYTFMKLIKSGYLSLYAFIPDGQTGYDGQWLVRKDGKSIEVPNLSFKKTMTNLTSDCPEISKLIDAGKYSKKDLLKIIDDYNECIDHRSTNTQVVQAVTPPAPASESELQKRWIAYGEKVKSHADFAGKADALEIIDDIAKRVGRAEKIPNFTIQGLRAAITEPDLTEELNWLLTETQKL